MINGFEESLQQRDAMNPGQGRLFRQALHNIQAEMPEKPRKLGGPDFGNLGKLGRCRQSRDEAEQGVVMGIHSRDEWLSTETHQLSVADGVGTPAREDNIRLFLENFEN
jgi:hypothetical protein